jgi:CBS domain-containing protein
MKKSTAAHLFSIEQYMTRSPHVVRGDAAVTEAQRMMREAEIRQLPVVDGETGKVVGIVSERDLLFFETTQTFDPARTRVDRVMRTDVYGVDRETPLDEVAATMASHKYGSAVVWSGGAVVGIFTTVDALRTLTNVVRREMKA